MIIDLTWKTLHLREAELMENGAVRMAWKLHSDARIKTADSVMGIGPVVYTAKPENPETGEYQYDGIIRDALFIFCDEADCVQAMANNADPGNLEETIADYMLSHGGNIQEMKALKPSVG